MLLSRVTPFTHRASADVLSRRLAKSSLLLAVLAWAALSVDLWVAYPFVTKSAGPIWEKCREGIQKIVQPGETFANGWTIVFVLMTFYAVDVAHRRQLLRAAVMVFGTGLLANLGKLACGRWRPKAFFDAGENAFSGGVLESFHTWLPWASLGYPGQSLPSGHTATAVALCVVLCRRWPHGRWAFVTLLAMAVAQRLSHGHHYVSDCLWGAALGCAVAAICLHPQLAGKWFDSFENGRTSPCSKQHTGQLAAEAA